MIPKYASLLAIAVSSLVASSLVSEAADPYCAMVAKKPAGLYVASCTNPAKCLRSVDAGLLGDAYSEQNKKEEAADQYKKAGTYFEKDELFSPEYLFRSGYLYESMGKTQDAIAMYKLIKDKYPSSQRGADIDKYLARLGVIQ